LAAKSGKLTVVASDLPLTSIDKEVAELFDEAVVVDLGGSGNG
jgi:hypothetical protein